MDNTKVNLLEQSRELILRCEALKGKVVDITEILKLHTAPPEMYFTVIYFDSRYYTAAHKSIPYRLKTQKVKLDMVTRHPSEISPPPIPYPHSYKFHFSKVYPPQSCPELENDDETKHLSFYNRYYGKRWILIKTK